VTRSGGNTIEVAAKAKRGQPNARNGKKVTNARPARQCPSVGGNENARRGDRPDYTPSGKEGGEMGGDGGGKAGWKEKKGHQHELSRAPAMVKGGEGRRGGKKNQQGRATGGAGGRVKGGCKTGESVVKKKTVAQKNGLGNAWRAEIKAKEERQALREGGRRAQGATNGRQ